MRQEKRKKLEMQIDEILKQTQRLQTKAYHAWAIPPLPRWLLLEASSVGPTWRQAAPTPTQ